MAIRNIVTEGDEILNKPCRKVEKFDARLHQMIDDMKETLKAAQGAGLAAPQVGILRQICVIDAVEGEEPLELINPEIIMEEGEQSGPEGCLSFPDQWALVSRPMKVTVRAQDRDGEWFEITGEELTARAFCHEIDHLQGTVFLDKATRMLTQEELESGSYMEEE